MRKVFEDTFAVVRKLSPDGQGCKMVDPERNPKRSLALSLSSDAPHFGEAKASNGALMGWMNDWVNEQYVRRLIIHPSVKLKGGALRTTLH